MNLLASEIPHSDIYAILLNSVAPRPIAWVSTLSASGQPNLAPFSFFNVLSVSPPLLGFSPGMRPHKDDATRGKPKDTLNNIRETKEFVVNVVTFELLPAMNITSGEYHSSVNEFELSKVTPATSKIVRPSRVAESPVSFECKLRQILDFSPLHTGSSLVIGEIVCIHMDDANMKDGRLDRDSLDLIGRMGGIQYTRTTERVELARPKVK
jgi:flavin reductase (DIM6/NTAB) family NADH-FMN oxidoreductase RutF